MEFAAVLTCLILVLVLVGLVFSRVSPDVLMTGAMAALVILGVLEPLSAFLGFANPGLMTISVLYIVAAALRETGAVQWLSRLFLGRPKGVRNAQLRILSFTPLLSAFMNNTTVVAMFIPAVQEWANRLQIPASKLLLPLSYAAILGGTCTLIGTSTNLVVNGLMLQQFGKGMGLFDIALVGLPVLMAGGLFLFFFADKLLPSKSGLSAQLDEVREYSVEFVVDNNSPLVGLSIESAGLRHMAHGYLAEISRGKRQIPMVSPDEILSAGDHLVFIGAPELAKELRSVQGISPSTGSIDKLQVSNRQRCILEAVLGQDFPHLNVSVRESAFRTTFGAVILSVSRGGKRVPGKLGDIVFQLGDTLLLEAPNTFLSQYQYRKDFLLLSELSDSSPPEFSKAPVALSILLGLVVTSATGIFSILEAAFLAAGAMLVTGCISAAKARRSIDLSVVIVIGASFALGTAMMETGAAAAIADFFTVSMVLSPLIALIMVYVLTVMFTELITNNAAAVLMFPIAVAIAERLGVSEMPFIICIMMAASASFITPLGYQTNLMVYGPGRYEFKDYVRIGLPMSVIVGTVVISLVTIFWPLS